MRETRQFFRGVAKLLGIRLPSNNVQVAVRIPPSAR